MALLQHNIKRYDQVWAAPKKAVRDSTISSSLHDFTLLAISKNEEIRNWQKFSAYSSHNDFEVIIFYEKGFN